MGHFALPPQKNRNFLVFRRKRDKFPYRKKKNRFQTYAANTTDRSNKMHCCPVCVENLTAVRNYYKYVYCHITFTPSEQGSLSSLT